MSGQNGQRGFRAVDRAKVLAQAAGKPTGILLAIGGQKIDLLAVPVGELLSVLDLLEKLSGLEALGKNADGTPNENGVSILTTLGKDGSRFIAVVKAVMRRSAFYGDADATADDRALFDEWFDALDPGELLRVALPKLTEATMVSANPQKATAASKTSTPPAESSSDATSNSSIPSFSS